LVQLGAVLVQRWGNLGATLKARFELYFSAKRSLWGCDGATLAQNFYAERTLAAV
jgi:hypothetical protein